MNNWISAFRHLSPILQLEIVLIFVMVVAIPIVAYLAFTRTRRRKKIAQRGIQVLGDKCPKCSGKMKPFDLFGGRWSYKIGAARCTRCKHLEVFNEEW